MKALISQNGAAYLAVSTGNQSAALCIDARFVRGKFSFMTTLPQFANAWTVNNVEMTRGSEVSTASF